MITACGSQQGSKSPNQDSASTSDLSTSKDKNNASEDNGELVDGKFVEKKSISVEVFDRGNDGGTPPEDNFYTDFIKEGMLRDHNVEVTFKIVPRWTEGEVLSNLLAANDAPDVCVTYSYPTIQTYANMGGVLDMAPYLEKNKDLLPDLWELLTDDNIYWNQDPEKGTIWAIEARLFNNAGVRTFVREDWLKKLSMEEPESIEDFEQMLYKFKDNAEMLLGDDADKMTPFSLSTDVGWRIMELAHAFIPGDITDRDRYIYGFDDRYLLYPNYKEAVRKINEWYNAGLVWKDFALYDAGDTTEGNLMKSGYVGSYMHNSDDPYRNGEDGVQYNMQKLVAKDAAFKTVVSFKNDAGLYKKYLSAPVDRKVFFPASNKEPVASLVYLDWISKLENRMFLQIGEEGSTHEAMPDGSVKITAATDEKIMNSPNNIDYTITINGLNLGDPEKTVQSLAQGYAGVDPEYITRTYDLSAYEVSYGKNAALGEIKAEEGMGTALSEKRNNFLTQSIVASVDKFDEVFDTGMQDYLNSGGQAIIDERKAAWEKVYSDKTMLD
jgi:putative aldouronate transport system substrate-binding protein